LHPDPAGAGCQMGLRWTLRPPASLSLGRAPRLRRFAAVFRFVGFELTESIGAGP